MKRFNFLRSANRCMKFTLGKIIFTLIGTLLTTISVGNGFRHFSEKGHV